MITDKNQIPIYRGLTENDSRYYRLSLLRTQNDVPKVSAITRVDCSWVLNFKGCLLLKSRIKRLSVGSCYMSSNWVIFCPFQAGCVHFPPVPQCDVKVLLLIFSPKKRAFVGLIPVEQVCIPTYVHYMLPCWKKLAATCTLQYFPPGGKFALFRIYVQFNFSLFISSQVI